MTFDLNNKSITSTYVYLSGFDMCFGYYCVRTAKHSYDVDSLRYPKSTATQISRLSSWANQPNLRKWYNLGVPSFLFTIVVYVLCKGCRVVPIFVCNPFSGFGEDHEPGFVLKIPFLSERLLIFCGSVLVVPIFLCSPFG